MYKGNNELIEELWIQCTNIEVPYLLRDFDCDRIRFEFVYKYWLIRNLICPVIDEVAIIRHIITWSLTTEISITGYCHLVHNAKYHTTPTPHRKEFGKTVYCSFCHNFYDCLF
jgi:hypothetical protein